MKTETDSFKVSQLYRRIDDIDLEPVFQREKVWSRPRQQEFIDTLIRGWGVPKIYLFFKEKTSGVKKYICVDGKQRLTALFSFLTDGFGLNKKFNENSSLANKKYSELPRDIQDKINEYIFTTEIIFDADETELAQLFKRLQLGVSLTSAEKLVAIPNEMTEFIKSITRTKFFKESIQSTSKRNAHHAVAAQICCLELNNNIISLKYSNLEQFVKSYPKFNSRGFEAKRIKEVLSLMYKIFGKDSELLSNRANIISFFLLISDLLKREDITKKTVNLKKFFSSFIKELDRVKSLDPNELSSIDVELLKYQNSVIQSADSSTSIKIRNTILTNRILNFSPFYRKVFRTITDEEKFKELYDFLESRYGGSPATFNKWLLKKFPNIKTKKCNKGIETIPVHVRHSMHHSDHPKYKKQELSYSITQLEKIK